MYTPLSLEAILLSCLLVLL